MQLCVAVLAAAFFVILVELPIIDFPMRCNLMILIVHSDDGINTHTHPTPKHKKKQRPNEFNGCS